MVPLAQPAGSLSEQKKISAAQIFLTQLDRFDAGFKRLFDDQKQIPALGLIAVGDQVKIEIGSGHVRVLSQNAFDRAGSGCVKFLSDPPSKKGFAAGFDGEPHCFSH
jgi:hypothetical protein